MVRQMRSPTYVDGELVVEQGIKATNGLSESLIGQPEENSVKKQSFKQKRAMVATLLANPSLTQKQIAEMVEVSEQTVFRVSKTLKALGDDDPVKIQRDAYRALMRKRLPDKKAVDAIEASMNDVRFALPAVKYRDQVLGVAPVETPVAPASQQPLISIPPGSEVLMRMQILGPGERKKDGE